MQIEKHPSGTTPAGEYAAKILDRHHAYIPGPRGQCLECERQGQGQLNVSSYEDRKWRRRRLAAWIVVLVLIAFAMWIGRHG